MKDLSHLEKYRCKEDELRVYGALGDNKNGIFKVYINGRSFFVIASNGCGWDHVSVSPKNQKRCPTWDEMCAIKDMFFDEEETVVQYHPKKCEYINDHPYVLHLWKKQNEDFQLPPQYMV